MKITKKNWPRMLLLVSYVAAFAFLVTLPTAQASLDWLFKSLFIIGAGGLLVSTSVLAWRRIVAGVAWVGRSADPSQRVRRWVAYVIAVVAGGVVAIKFWFIPLIFSFTFLAVPIQNVPRVHF